MIEAYPLYWPEGRPRCDRWRRETARFASSFARSRDEVVHQVELLVGGKWQLERAGGVIISTNIALRRDGLPLANQRQPDDVGVAVYFKYKDKPVCFACDRWKKIEDNMQAIAKTIDALRGITRWGTGDMLEAAFKGFTALPSPGQSSARTWRTIMGFAEGERPDHDTIKARWRKLSMERHPDRGGSDQAMAELNRAYSEATA